MMGLVRRSGMGRRLLVGGALVLAVLTPGQGSAAEECGGGAADPRPAYLCRGDQVEARYEGYRKRLEGFFERFGTTLRGEAADLDARLREAPPAPVPYGYQILPKLVPDAPRLPGRWYEVASASYSWRRTEGFIDQDLRRLEALGARLAQAGGTSAEDRRKEFEKMVDEYKTLAANQKLIAAHIRYNRLWQGEITRHRAAYDHRTVLLDAALERGALIGALPAGDQVLEAHLWARAQALFRQVRDATPRALPPDFVRVEHPSLHRWIVRVPVYTDIEDRSFVERFQAAVEKVWQVRDGDDEFSVAVEIRHVPPRQLYADGDVPAHGAHIDLAQHIGRFPADGGVLTTGANNMHVLGRGINLGPQSVSINAFAHEFGHILGFRDGYFRGYRDRGPEGYEVLEVGGIDGEDIMTAPGEGHVSRHHFQHLLDARAPR